MLLRELQDIVAHIPLDAQLPGTPLLTDCLRHLMQRYIVLQADTASLIQAGNEMRKNLGIWTGQIESPCYRWDEVVKQTTAIGAVLLLREAEEAETLRSKVQSLEAALTFAVFPAGQTYDEWVAGGAHNNPANSELWEHKDE